MTRHATVATRAHTRDGARITTRFDLTHYARVLEARAVNGLVLGGPAWQGHGAPQAIAEYYATIPTPTPEEQ